MRKHPLNNFGHDKHLIFINCSDTLKDVFQEVFRLVWKEILRHLSNDRIIGQYAQCLGRFLVCIRADALKFR